MKMSAKIFAASLVLTLTLTGCAALNSAGASTESRAEATAQYTSETSASYGQTALDETQNTGTSGETQNAGTGNEIHNSNEEETGGAISAAANSTGTNVAGSTWAAGNYEYETSELYSSRDGYSIYGVIYVPQGAGEKMPAVIYAHGYGVTHANGVQYAERLAAAGYVVYCFDFCGGGNASRSDGSTLEMTVFTEQADLEAVTETVMSLDYVDESNVFLFGASQGGLVAGLTAAANPDDYRGLILLYPGFEIADDVRELFPTREDIPDSYAIFGWMTVGRPYFEALIDYDVYATIGAYKNDVLMIHGDSDGIVNISSSERALEVYESATLRVLSGAGHGLSGSNAVTATEYMLEYLNEHVML